MAERFSESEKPFVINQPSLENRHRGTVTRPPLPHPAYMRFRIRRFGGLSYSVSKRGSVEVPQNRSKHRETSCSRPDCSPVASGCEEHFHPFTSKLSNMLGTQKGPAARSHRSFLCQASRCITDPRVFPVPGNPFRSLRSSWRSPISAPGPVPDVLPILEIVPVGAPLDCWP
jgi:hypothetical protein